MTIDREWALGELRRFVVLTTLVPPPPLGPRGGYVGDARRPRAERDEIVTAAHVAEQILDRVVSTWRKSIPPDERGRWQQHREAAQRAIVQLERAAEVQTRLGDDAPQLSAGHLHPWVWQGARSMWQSGHYRQAVFDAAKRINAEMQNKMGTREISETDLANQAFSDDPPNQKRPRLRLPEDDDGKTAKSLRRGIRAYAEGCFAAIRNPASHDIQDELGEDQALEQLAAFSVLARWVDRAHIVSAA